MVSVYRWHQEWGTVVIGLTMLLFGRMWTLESSEYIKWNLMAYPSRIGIWKFVTESNCEVLAQESSVENFIMWPTHCFCGLLVKNVATFCICLKSLKLR